MEQYFIGPKPNWYPTGNRELLFGLYSAFAGLFLGNAIYYGGFRMGFALGAAAAIALGWAYLHRSGHTGDGYTRTVLALGILIALGFGWSCDGFVKFWMLLFLAAAINTAFCQMTGRNRFAAGSLRSLADGFRTAACFHRIAPSCRGVASAFRSGNALTQRSGAVLAGLAIGLPMAAVVIPLLMFADAAFEGLMELLPDFDVAEILSTLILGGAITVYHYSRAVGLVHAQTPAPRPKTHNGIHVLTMDTALGAVCVVYALYLVSQLAYFFGGFAGILPEGYTAAEYARRGFFEMAWLCAINLGLMTFGVGLVRQEDRVPASTRALCLFLGLITEFLVAAGAAKMALYIGSFGLTRLRVLTMVIMVFLAITTGIVAAWLYFPKIQYMKVVMAAALVLGAAVLWADVDTQVAKYNVDAYLCGKHKTLDIHYLEELGPGSLEAVARLKGDGAYGGWAELHLRHYDVVFGTDFRSMTVIANRAHGLQLAWSADGNEAVEP